MSYAKLLNNRCNIYHLQSQTSSGGFGVPGETTFYYDADPDIVNEPCYFSVGQSQGQSISQGEPNNVISQTFLAHFLPSADVRLNDKVVWNGIELRLQVPRKIKNHHWEVPAVRDDNL